MTSKEKLARQSFLVRDWRKKIKETIINCLGGKCNKCGYNKHISTLAFHHLRDKKFAISSIISSPTKVAEVIEEAKKCIILCHNCHSEFHNNLWKIDEINIFEFDEKIYSETAPKYGGVCICGKKYTKSLNNRRFCSEECKPENQKVGRPPKEELEKLLWIKPTSKIADDYGVSDTAVGKWVKFYELTKPPRGYWQQVMKKERLGKLKDKLWYFTNE